MTRLLNANFARLFKGKLFWICAAAAVVLGAMEIIPHVANMTEDSRPEWYLFNASGFFLMIMTAIFVGLFVGEEYGGTLRNMIIVGQKRSAIYFSNLIICLFGVSVFHLLYWGSILAAGVIFGCKITVSSGVIAVYELLQLSSLLGMCAVFTAITLLIPKKIAGALACLILIVGLYFVNTLVFSRLIDLDAIYLSDIGITSAELAERNFLYFLRNILPFGQEEQISVGFNGELQSFSATEPVPFKIALCSLGEIAAATAVGVIVFRKMDVK